MKSSWNLENNAKIYADSWGLVCELSVGSKRFPWWLYYGYSYYHKSISLKIRGFWLGGTEKSVVVNKRKRHRREILRTCGDITQQIRAPFILQVPWVKYQQLQGSYRTSITPIPGDLTCPCGLSSHCTCTVTRHSSRQHIQMHKTWWGILLGFYL